jgi:uncharacterized membrane protein
MNNKIIVVAFIATAALSFFLGKNSVEVKETSNTKIEDTKQIDKDSHVKVVQTTTKKPDGEETTTTVTTRDTETHIEDTKKVDEVISKIVENNRPKLNISLLVSAKPELPLIPVYGVSINKEVLGPITVGAFLLTNRTIGASIGLNF